MVVNTVSRSCGNDGTITSEEISMSPVYSDKDGSANKEWSKFTPCGQLKFTVTNQLAFEKVLPGQFYFVTLNQTDKDTL